jgi:PKD repeat protein
MKNLIFLFVFFCLSVAATAQNCNPIVSFNQNPDGSYQFYGYTTDSTFLGAPVSWAWSFNPNPTTSTEQSPVVAFNAPGIYQVCLAITTGIGCTGTGCTTLTIAEPPACSASFTSTSADGIVTATSTSSTLDGTISSYFWFGNGLAYGSSNTATIDANGLDSLNLCLTINTTNGCSDTYCSGVYVGSGPTCNADFHTAVDANTVSFTNTSTGDDLMAYFWDFGDGTNASTLNATHNYPTGDATYTACLTVYGSGNPATGGYDCTNTMCQTIVIGGGSGTECEVSFGQTSTDGLTFLFGVNSGASDAVLWAWDFGDGTTANNPYQVAHTYAANGYYAACLTVTFANVLGTCTAYYCDSLQVTGAGGNTETSLCGNIYPASADSTDWVNLYGATVYLIEHNTAEGTLTAIAQQDVFSAPGAVGLNYCFDNLTVGNEYLVKAALLPESPFYATYLPTYSTNSLTWADANPIVLGDFVPNYAQIQLVEGVNPGGAGFIGGNISDGAGKTESTGLAGIEVILYNATHQAVAVTYTNADGNYSFANLAYGTYYVAVEVLNHTSDEIMVVLSGSNASSVANSFVDAGDTFEAQASSVQANTVLLNSLNLMPNIANTNSVVIIRSSKNTLSQVNVYDITGKLVASQRGNATQISLNTAGLTQGMYLCNVLDANGNTATCKLIVQ